jgi:hypothetical protein
MLVHYFSSLGTLLHSHVCCSHFSCKDYPSNSAIRSNITTCMTWHAKDALAHICNFVHGFRMLFSQGRLVHNVPQTFATKPESRESVSECCATVCIARQRNCASTWLSTCLRILSKGGRFGCPEVSATRRFGRKLRRRHTYFVVCVSRNVC